MASPPAAALSLEHPEHGGRLLHRCNSAEPLNRSPQPSRSFRPQIRSTFQARPPDHLAHGPQPPRIRTGFRRFPGSWWLSWARCRGLNRSPKAPRASGGRSSALPPGFGPSGASGAPSRPFLSPYGAFLVYFHIPPSPHFAKKGLRVGNVHPRHRPKWIP